MGMVIWLTWWHACRLNRKAKYNLEKNLADKFTAMRIDEHNAELRTDSAGLQFVPAAAKISAKYVINHAGLMARGRVPSPPPAPH